MKMCLPRPLFLARFYICSALLTVVSACTNSGETSPAEVNQVSFNQKIIEAPIQADGTIIVEFDLNTPQTSMQLIAEDPARTLRLIGVADPQGRELFDVSDPFDAHTTTADEAQQGVNVVNLPVVAKGHLRDLSAGTYTVVYTSALPTPSPTAVADDVFSLTVVSKKDDDITSGAVPVLVYVPSAIADSEDSLQAIENSLDVARQLFTGAGLSLQYRIIRDDTLPNILPNPAFGNALYRQYSDDRPGRVLMFVGVSVERLQAPLNRIGQAGSSPGALAATNRSAIAISLTAAAGSDGLIDSKEDRRDPRHTSEVRLMGEAMAHELMHYLGLQDTMVFSGNNAVAADSTDSPKCPTLDACRIDPDAPRNVMFPYPLNRDDEGGRRPRSQDDFIPREFVSTLQEIVLQLALGVE